MTCEPSAIEIHNQLLELQAERALASIEELAANSAYRGRLAQRRQVAWGAVQIARRAATYW